MTVESHPSPTAPEADIKTFPSPPPTTHHQISCTINVGALEHDTRRFLNVKKIAKWRLPNPDVWKTGTKEPPFYGYFPKSHRISSFTEKTDGYIEDCVFGNFQIFREPRFKMSEPGFWVFSPPSGKGVNIVFVCGDIHALGWDPRVLFWENFRLWRPNRAFGVAGVA
jgi:hypothetical protein